MFLEHYQEADTNSRVKIYQYLDKYSAELSYSYLDFLVKNGDYSVEMNTLLLKRHLELAQSSGNKCDVEEFQRLILQCQYYDAHIILALINRDQFPMETIHLYRLLKMHKNAIEALFTLDIKKAEKYCQEEYNQYDSNSLYLYDELFKVMVQQSMISEEGIIKFLNSHGYRLSVTPFAKIDPHLEMARFSKFLIRNKRYWTCKTYSSKMREAFLSILSLSVIQH